LDLLAALKSNPRFAPIPFLIVTASKWAERERRRALELGALRFLQRPLEPSELLSEVETCLEGAEAR
jgi:response regulator RpfG family c-di-GMP phosphodiesterase